MSTTPEYRVWICLVQRCTNPSDVAYAHYGARGITVCARWKESFEAFYADMGARPSDDHQIERKDNDGPYAPENCIWATPSAQARNRRSSRRITASGVTLTAVEWSERTGVPLGTIYDRLNHGWPPEEAVALPVSQHQRREKRRSA